MSANTNRKIDSSDTANHLSRSIWNAWAIKENILNLCVSLLWHIGMRYFGEKKQFYQARQCDIYPSCLDVMDRPYNTLDDSPLTQIKGFHVLFALQRGDRFVCMYGTWRAVMRSIPVQPAKWNPNKRSCFTLTTAYLGGLWRPYMGTEWPYFLEFIRNHTLPYIALHHL